MASRRSAGWKTAACPCCLTVRRRKINLAWKTLPKLVDRLDDPGQNQAPTEVTKMLGTRNAFASTSMPHRGTKRKSEARPPFLHRFKKPSLYLQISQETSSELRHRSSTVDDLTLFQTPTFRGKSVDLSHVLSRMQFIINDEWEAQPLSKDLETLRGNSKPSRTVQTQIEWIMAYNT